MATRGAKVTDGRAQRVASICAECGAPVDFELGAHQVRCEHCDAGLVVDKAQRLVRLACPACCGNFYYLDGSMGGRCPYCQASLLAVSRHRLLRFLITPAAGAPVEAPDAALVMLPFWHLSGLVFCWDVGTKVTIEEDPKGDVAPTDRGGIPIPAKVRRDAGPIKSFKGRVADLTLPDPSTRAFGVTSLRWRAAVFPMEPFSEAHEQLGRVVPPTLDIEQVRESLYARALTVGRLPEDMTRVDCQRQDLVSEELALYYYPFWVTRDESGRLLIWDGVTGEPEKTSAPSPVPTLSDVPSPFDDLTVIELRCKKCGKALPAGNHSVVLPCTSCSQFWLVEREGLLPFEAHFASLDFDAAQDRRVAWLPFWRVPTTVRFRGNEATEVKDLIQKLGVMRLSSGEAQSEAGESPLHYFVPAYGSLRAPRPDHAARDMTRCQPRLRAGLVGEKSEMFHCFFGPEDARELAYSTWIQILPSAIGHQIRSIRVESGEPMLWYVPFEEKGREIVNLITGTRYERAAFRGLRH